MAQATTKEVAGYQDVVYMQVTTGADTNSTSTVTPTISMPNMSSAALFVDNESGTTTTNVVTLQTSHDATTWVDETNTVTGTGTAKNTGLIGKYIRAKCTTAQGVASVAIITLIIK